MITKFREQFNKAFSQEKYQQLQHKIEEAAQSEIAFRLSESPVFLTKDFKEKVFSAAKSIIQQIETFSEEELNKAIPPDSVAPGDASHYHFLAVDFGICKNEKGEVVPQLIELQAFPSLFGFQYQYETSLREVYPFLKEFERPISEEEYIEKLYNVVVGSENPENVILLELFPEKQKTNIDFYITEKLLGIKTVCYTQLIKEGRKLYYDNKGKKTPINRIYNRVIFDELHHHKELKTQFQFTDNVDVTWVTHPNWFFKVSKYILPKLHHEFIPDTFYLSEAPKDLNLEQYVLKPLFSFAGSGINLHPTQEILDKIEDKENYILQKKVTYAPLFKDINGDKSKAEIRLLFVKAEEDEKPYFMTNLVRMTKADMVNVDFNKKDAIWIGSSIALFENNAE